MTRIWASFILGAALLSVPAAADDTRNDPNRIICKSDKRTNSRLPANKVCHTRGEWDQIAEANKRMYGEQRDRIVVETRRDQ